MKNEDVRVMHYRGMRFGQMKETMLKIQNEIVNSFLIRGTKRYVVEIHASDKLKDLKDDLAKALDLAGNHAKNFSGAELKVFIDLSKKLGVHEKDLTI